MALTNPNIWNSRHRKKSQWFHTTWNIRDLLENPWDHYGWLRMLLGFISVLSLKLLHPFVKLSMKYSRYNFITHFMQLVSFDTSWKHQKTFSFQKRPVVSKPLGVSKETSGMKWVKFPQTSQEMRESLRIWNYLEWSKP